MNRLLIVVGPRLLWIVEIDWERGSFENASVAWIDEKTMTYQIVDHSQRIQIGMSTTFRRQ